MLWYYDLSRRKFLQILGFSAGAATLSGVMPAAAAATRTVREPMHRLLARGLVEGGAQVATAVPATGTAKIFDDLNDLSDAGHPWSCNEEVAYSVAHGAALAGTRSATVVKAHGFAKAANSVLDSLTAGVTAGFVAVVTLDPAGRHSDSIFDASGFVKGSGIPFRTVRPHEACDAARDALDWSQQLGLPVALLVDSDDLDETAEAVSRPPAKSTAAYERDPYRHVLCPPLAGYQHRVLEARRTGADWRDIERPPEIRIPDSLPARWRKLISGYEPVFEVFAEMRGEIGFASGDTGLSSMFAFEPCGCIDATTYYGGSLPLALGAHLAGRRGVWAVTGDFAFTAAGHLGLLEAVARSAPLKVLVLHNGCSLTTGGQPLPGGVFEGLVSGWAGRVRRVRLPYGDGALRTVLRGAMDSDDLEIVVVDCPVPDAGEVA